VGPTQAVAAVRHAVRLALEPVALESPGAVVLAACSGGGDSVALAAALAFEAPRLGLRAGGVTVDHGLQAGSGARASAVVALLRGLGLDPAIDVAVVVDGEGGPEAAARSARYRALREAADRAGAAVMLLGHTLDDQAETVLLGLARGSGTRSLAGMAETTGEGGLFRRPLLQVPRATTAKACADADLPVWSDPHNGDAAFSRVRVRSRVLPVLESELGPGIAAALARTAALARDDADALDHWAERVFAELARHGGGSVELDADELAALPPAIRRRVLRLAALAIGVGAGELAAVQLHAVDALLTGWRGQGAVSLPGGYSAFRRYGRLTVSSNAVRNATVHPDGRNL
jgi:tRNA(Ile)-lysidine synthase